MALKIKTETRQGNFHDELKISGRRSEWGGVPKNQLITDNHFLLCRLNKKFMIG